ncbi:carotenoid oxygenase family protein [Microcoleus sp. N9_B4]|uniref:carotenoid oxygenase family protein n=1 Tax=Microcoleus sp. N9_B4 TaxID=3055386 RepID=UPI002FD53371
MNQPTQNPTPAVTGGCPPVPESLVKAKRDELTDIKLNITKMGEKDLPDDLRGHVFIIAPVGTIESGGLPFTNGDSFLSGDGMIYRLDFQQKGKVLLTTRIIRPPDYYADEATQPGEKYAKYQFRNHGIIRFSWCLGSRNDLSIAFLPMKFAGDSQERLLVAYDAGRHYEIDTETLEVATPIGWNKEWRGEIELNFPLQCLNFPFSPVLSTAHPVFDVRKSEMFTVNYGMSLKTFLGIVTNTANKLAKQVKKVFPPAKNYVDKFKLPEDFIYLIRWDGKEELERWQLVLPDGSPVKIKQSIHQIGFSKNYVVIVDTSFRTGIEQIINNPFPKNKRLEECLRKKLDVMELATTPVYLVPRDRLTKGQKSGISDRNQDVPTVTVQKVEIPLEITHFLVDYDNPEQLITLHAAHTCAWDVSEWIRAYDDSPFDPKLPRPQGMEQSEMDISRVGRYVINGETGEIVEQKVIPEKFIPEAEECRCTWGVALYAYLDRLPSTLYPTMPPGKLDNIYWISLGLWKDLVSKFMVDFFKDYPSREVPLEELLRIAQEEGRPSSLFRMDTSSTESMKIADSYEFPPGCIGLSPQFIPRGDGNSSTDGYITCTVWLNNTYEIWIFEAWALNQGPQWKLSDSSLNFGLTLHTTWLPSIGRRQASYNVPVREDYQELVAQKRSQEIQDLFDEKVYPHFEKELKSI